MFNRIIAKVLAASPSADQIHEATKINLDKYGNFGAIFVKVLDWIVWFGGVLIFFYLVASGITYITAGGNAEQAKKGQQGVINGVIGIIVLTLSFAIVKAVAKMFNK